MTARANLRWTMAAGLAALLLFPAAALAHTTDAAVERGLRQLVRASGGPPGAIAR